MPLILPGNVGSATAAIGFNVANSCRFDSASSADLRISDYSGAGTSRKTRTYSMWIKRSELSYAVIFGSAGKDHWVFTADHKIQINIGSGTDSRRITDMVFRDVSAWYHIVFAYDTTQGTAANRFTMWVNGAVATTSIVAGKNEVAEDEEALVFINGDTHTIGSDEDSASYCDCYMAEWVFVDGQKLDADSFGEYDSDSGIWKPKDVSGITLGTNGFYLNFADSSDLGIDAGNDNDFEPTNLTATDQTTDTCTNNFATWNPLACAMQNVANNVTFSEGNLKAVGTSGGEGTLLSTIAVNSGKWYAEFKMIDVADGNFSQVALLDELGAVKIGGGTGATVSVGNVTVKPNGDLFINETRSAGWGPTFTDNDIIQIAADLDNGAFYFGKNGTYSNSGNPESGASKTGAAYAFTASSKLWFFAGGLNGTGSAVEANFGSPSFTISSGNTDGDGYGNFEYAVPSGYFALNTKNLAEYGG